MKMKEPEMEVVRFMAEDVLTASGGGHTLVNHLLVCNSGHSGEEHYQATTKIKTAPRVNCNAYDADGNDMYACVYPEYDEFNAADLAELLPRLDSGEKVWLYKDNSVYFICGSGQ